MLRAAKVALTLAALIVTPSVEALACPCKGVPSPADDFRDAQAVFLGKVLWTQYEDGETIAGAGFRVETSWKGTDADEVKVNTLNNTCGIKFREGESYVVYARSFSGDLLTNACSRTAPVIEASEQMTDLRGRATLPLAPTDGGKSGVALLTGLFVLSFLGVGLLLKRVTNRAA
jgi:hypothetical protein